MMIGDCRNRIHINTYTTYAENINVSIKEFIKKFCQWSCKGKNAYNIQKFTKID